MWVFITARLRQWLILAVLIPVATMLVHALKRFLERRSGQTRLTRGLGWLENLGQRHGRRRRR
jgi:hypothetical protein